MVHGVPGQPVQAPHEPSPSGRPIATAVHLKRLPGCMRQGARRHGPWRAGFGVQVGVGVGARWRGAAESRRMTGGRGRAARRVRTLNTPRIPTAKVGPPAPPQALPLPTPPPSPGAAGCPRCSAGPCFLTIPFKTSTSLPPRSIAAQLSCCPVHWSSQHARDTAADDRRPAARGPPGSHHRGHRSCVGVSALWHDGRKRAGTHARTQGKARRDEARRHQLPPQPPDSSARSP